MRPLSVVIRYICLTHTSNVNLGNVGFHGKGRFRIRIKFSQTITGVRSYMARYARMWKNRNARSTSTFAPQPKHFNSVLSVEMEMAAEPHEQRDSILPDSLRGKRAVCISRVVTFLRGVTNVASILFRRLGLSLTPSIYEPIRSLSSARPVGTPRHDQFQIQNPPLPSRFRGKKGKIFYAVRGEDIINITRSHMGVRGVRNFR